MTGACCGSCAVGGPCGGERRAVTRTPDRRGALRLRAPVSYSVGRGQPNNEIAQLDAAAEQLRSDLAAYDPPPGDPQFANWAALTHAANGWILRWGQFKRDIASDLWWGDDDEVRLATLKTEYNTIRQQVIDSTGVKPTAPAVDPSPPGLDPPPPTSDAEKTLLGLGALVLLGGAGYAAYKIIPLLVPVLSTAVGAAAGAAAQREAGAS